jgi:hypothetical protein
LPELPLVRRSLLRRLGLIRLESSVWPCIGKLIWEGAGAGLERAVRAYKLVIRNYRYRLSCS